MNNIDNAFKRLNEIQEELQTTLKEIGIDASKVHFDYTDLDESFKYEQLREITTLLNEATSRLEYLSLDIIKEGYLKLNNEGRYAFSDTKYLTTGSEIEILVDDVDGKQWHYTTIEYKQDNYCVVINDVNYSLENNLVRIRR